MINKLKIESLIIIVLFIIAIFSRIYLWPNTIDDINCDEAMTAINAKAIAETGRDMYGTSLPVYFETWLYGGQSALLTYFMVFCIKIFGFNLFSIRLPMLIVSIFSIFVFYKLMEIIFNNKKITIITTALLAINPWHIMQSIWSLDCNMFPHILLLAIYLLTKGIKEQRNIFIYTSMLFFGITTYTYGIALYFVPIFLIVYMLFLLKCKKINWNTVLISALIVVTISLPLILMTIINLFDLPNIKIGPITIQNFKYFTRNSDMIIFSKNIPNQLLKNMKALVNLMIINSDGLIWNAIPNVGAIYAGSFLFAIIGLVLLFKDKTIQNKNIILIWIIVSLLIGILINNVNINRLNVIWYPLIILVGFGIYKILEAVEYNKICMVILVTLFIINFSTFNYYFYDEYREKIANSYTWSNGLAKKTQQELGFDENNTTLSNDKKIIFAIYSLKYDFNKNGFLDKKILLNCYYGLKNDEFIDIINKTTQ